MMRNAMMKLRHAAHEGECHNQNLTLLFENDVGSCQLQLWQGQQHNDAIHHKHMVTDWDRQQQASAELS